MEKQPQIRLSMQTCLKAATSGQIVSAVLDLCWSPVAPWTALAAHAGEPRILLRREVPRMSSWPVATA